MTTGRLVPKSLQRPSFLRWPRLSRASKKESFPPQNAETLFEKAKDQVLTQWTQSEPWDDDVFCLNALRIEVV